MKKKIAAVVVILAAVLSVIYILQPKTHDIEGEVIFVRTLSVSEDVDNYVIRINGSEFGYGESIYILITADTVVQSADGKTFLPESFIAGDIVKIYYKKTSQNTSESNVIEASRVIYEYHVKK